VDGCGAALGERVGSLQVLAATEQIPTDVLAVRPGFPPALRARILAAAGTLTSTRAGLRTLSAGFLSEGLVPSAPADFAPVRKTLETLRR
jgi:ABC-type phosphate/phosphonate transport system substrate-binding protein